MLRGTSGEGKRAQTVLSAGSHLPNQQDRGACWVGRPKFCPHSISCRTPAKTVAVRKIKSRTGRERQLCERCHARWIAQLPCKGLPMTPFNHKSPLSGRDNLLGSAESGDEPQDDASECAPCRRPPRRRRTQNHSGDASRGKQSLRSCAGRMADQRILGHSRGL